MRSPLIWKSFLKVVNKFLVVETSSQEFATVGHLEAILVKVKVRNED